MNVEQTKRKIRNDLEEMITNSKRALELFDKGELDKTKDEIEEIYGSCDFTIAELDDVIEEEEKQQKMAEPTPPPQSSPPEPKSVPAGSPE